jgi:putative ABC transport system ATP-binding protein
MTPILQLSKVSKTYRRRERDDVAALREVSLCLEAGSMQVVSGPSGSGKSTLLLCAGGLLKPDTGGVVLAGQRVYELSSEERSILRARNIGFVFQQFHLVPFLSVLDNILIPVLSGEGGDGTPARAEALVERFGLGHRRNHPTAELSVGERQRVALARALLFNPKLLLADEPTGNLDEQNGKLVLEALVEFAEVGGAVLLVTHDRRLKIGEAHRLEDGVLRRLPAGKE